MADGRVLQLRKFTTIESVENYAGKEGELSYFRPASNDVAKVLPTVFSHTGTSGGGSR